MSNESERYEMRKAMPGEFIPEDYFCELNAQDVFANSAPLEVDLGSGDGRFLIEMAKHHPERNFLGVERLLGRVKTISNSIERENLTNCKVLRLESQYTVECILPNNSVDHVHLLCPDPWPKAKHHKNRLIQQEFLELLFQTLKPNGLFFFKTDHPEYFEWVEDYMTAFAKFERLEWHDEDFFYPKTDFQLQWEAEGKTIHKLLFRKPTNE